MKTICFIIGMLSILITVTSDHTTALPTLVRLVNGDTSSEGRVEVYHNGIWGTVCDEYWSTNDAKVVCHMLGFPGVVSTFRDAYFGEGVGIVWLSRLLCRGDEDDIGYCSHSGWGANTCQHSDDASVICINSVRIVGGNFYNKGRVEIYHYGAWGTVCDDGWDMNDAKVICRMLGFPDATFGKSYGFYGMGVGQIWLDDVNCVGNEIHINNCRHGGWGVHDCKHSEDASVECKPTVRLNDGDRSNEGRVEIYHTHAWGTICDNLWWDYDAKVVCRMLDFPGVVDSQSNAYYGEGNGQIWLDYVSCSGDEVSLVKCSHRGWADHTCTHAEDASVLCLPSVRLMNGGSNAEGRVEILHNGEWGTICDKSWDIHDADVVCRMLGFPAAKAALRQAFFGEGTSRIWLDDVNCRGNESALEECIAYNEWGNHECGHQQDASVKCNPSVRLVGGNATREGRVEINHLGEWGTICDSLWFESEADTVCKMLGYPGSIYTWGVFFGEGTGRIWLDFVNCDGTENSVLDCNHRGWGNHACDHSEDVSVVCLPSVRLRNGGEINEGRVEIYHAGLWGTVCDKMWDIDDAQVVCRMLGFRGALLTFQNAYFDEGSGPIWLEDLQCTGTENSVIECNYARWGSVCVHGQDASVRCIHPDVECDNIICEDYDMCCGVNRYGECCSTHNACKFLPGCLFSKQCNQIDSRNSYCCSNGFCCSYSICIKDTTTGVNCNNEVCEDFDYCCNSIKNNTCCSTHSGTKLSTNEVVGIVFGVLGFILFATITYYAFRRIREKRKIEQDAQGLERQARISPRPQRAVRIRRDVFRRESLNENSFLYLCVASHFYRSFTRNNPVIIQIEKIYNINLYNMFQEYKSLIQSQNDQPTVVKNLFHGTTGDSAAEICRNGFNRIYAGRNGTLYGSGVYFSTDASYALNFTGPSWMQPKYMFLAEVVTGRYARGQAHFREAPYIPNFNRQRYDSVVDDVLNPSIFVVFKDHSVFPTYLITFSTN